MYVPTCIYITFLNDIYMYIYIYIYIHIHICISIHVHIYIYIFTCIHDAALIPISLLLHPLLTIQNCIPHIFLLFRFLALFLFDRAFVLITAQCDRNSFELEASGHLPQDVSSSAVVGVGTRLRMSAAARWWAWALASGCQQQRGGGRVPKHAHTHKHMCTL
jgi:hypothetical protein